MLSMLQISPIVTPPWVSTWLMLPGLVTDCSPPSHLITQNWVRYHEIRTGISIKHIYFNLRHSLSTDTFYTLLLNCYLSILSIHHIFLADRQWMYVIYYNSLIISSNFEGHRMAWMEFIFSGYGYRMCVQPLASISFHQCNCHRAGSGRIIREGRPEAGCWGQARQPPAVRRGHTGMGSWPLCLSWARH